VKVSVIYLPTNPVMGPNIICVLCSGPPITQDFARSSPDETGDYQ
jgi:hypothetical protein